MKILLVQPAPFETARVGLETALWLSEPVALTSIAAMVREQHEVRILDMRLEDDEALPRALAEFRPQLVGASCMTTDAYQAQAVAYAAKSILGDGVFTILGGHHPTLAPDSHDHPAVDAVCIGEGEETFAELVEHLDRGGDPRELSGIPGLAWHEGGELRRSPDRSQARQLDTFPDPARELLSAYRGKYFFSAAENMGSIQTSRGCAFDCNFCAIWEFYQRKVRFLSPEAMCDRMEAMEEEFIFFLDDNFLTHRPRLEAFLDELEKRGIQKYWMIQGRSDFIARNPDLLRRMRDLGLMMVLSGYESNDDDTLGTLKKDNTRENNLAAARILHDLGIYSTGIFMTHPDWEGRQFDDLYAIINEMRITIPLVVIHTPLPGTQGFHRERHTLLTEDARLFDLTHAVVATKLPRAEFYGHYSRWVSATDPGTKRSLTAKFLMKRPRLSMRMGRGYPRLRRRLKELRTVLEDPQSFLQSEREIIDEARASTRAEEAAA